MKLRLIKLNPGDESFCFNCKIKINNQTGIGTTGYRYYCHMCLEKKFNIKVGEKNEPKSKS